MQSRQLRINAFFFFLRPNSCTNEPISKFQAQLCIPKVGGSQGVRDVAGQEALVR